MDFESLSNQLYYFEKNSVKGIIQIKEKTNKDNLKTVKFKILGYETIDSENNLLTTQTLNWEEFKNYKCSFLTFDKTDKTYLAGLLKTSTEINKSVEEYKNKFFTKNKYIEKNGIYFKISSINNQFIEVDTIYHENKHFNNISISYPLKMFGDFNPLTETEIDTFYIQKRLKENNLSEQTIKIMNKDFPHLSKMFRQNEHIFMNKDLVFFTHNNIDTTYGIGYIENIQDNKIKTFKVISLNSKFPVEIDNNFLNTLCNFRKLNAEDYDLEYNYIKSDSFIKSKNRLAAFKIGNIYFNKSKNKYVKVLNHDPKNKNIIIAKDLNTDTTYPVFLLTLKNDDERIIITEEYAKNNTLPDFVTKELTNTNITTTEIKTETNYLDMLYLGLGAFLLSKSNNAQKFLDKTSKKRELNASSDNRKDSK